MMRPQHETERDRQIEADIAKRVGDYWGCSIVKIPKSYVLDRAAIRLGGIVAWVEIKRRHCTLKRHPNSWLPLQKVLAARRLKETTNLSSFFIAQFDDCLAHTLIPIADVGVDFVGRTDRGDPQDQEPMALIPTDAFIIIERTMAVA